MNKSHRWSAEKHGHAPQRNSRSLFVTRQWKSVFRQELGKYYFVVRQRRATRSQIFVERQSTLTAVNLQRLSRHHCAQNPTSRRVKSAWCTHCSSCSSGFGLELRSSRWRVTVTLFSPAHTKNKFALCSHTPNEGCPQFVHKTNLNHCRQK